MDFATALSIAKDSRGSNDNQYREALEHLIDNRAELKSRIFVLIPGGMTSNTDPTWDKVRQNTESRCGCGNERTLLPLSVRETYEPGETRTVGYKESIHVRPKGSDKESCIVSLEIVCFEDGPEGAQPEQPDPAESQDAKESDPGDSTKPASVEAQAESAEPAESAPAAEAPKPRTYGMRLTKDPFGPVDVAAFLSVLAPTAYRLDGMAEKFPEGGLNLMFVEGPRKLPVLKITAVDPAKPEVTVVLDADMEVFDPTIEPDRHFVQMAVMTIGGPGEDAGPPAAEGETASPAPQASAPGEAPQPE